MLIPKILDNRAKLLIALAFTVWLTLLACKVDVKDRKNGKRAALSEARKIIRQACHILTELGDDALAAA